MGQTASEIRSDIEQTRSRMSATIEAIGYRLDVPARMRYRFSHIMHDVSGALARRPNGHNGGESLVGMGEEKVESMIQAAKGGVADTAEAVEGPDERHRPDGPDRRSGCQGDCRG